MNLPTYTPAISFPTNSPAPTFVQPTSTNYLTPLPTLTREQAVDTFNRFYTDNNECALPCWWGITPGFSSWTETKQFIEQFNLWGGIGQAKWSITNSTTYNNYVWYVDSPNSASDDSPPIFLEVQDNIVTAVQIDGTIASYQFPLHKFLDENGIPDKILLDTERSKDDLNVFFADFLVIYENKYVLSMYEFVGQGTTSPIRMCLYNIQLRPLIIWSPDKELKMDFSDFKVLDMYSELNPDTFYETFKSKENKCLNISLSAWD